MILLSYKLVFLLCLVLMHNLSDAYKILVIFAYPGKSHGILGEGYVRNLIKAGHEVTYIASVPLKDSLPGLRQIDVSQNFEIYPAESYLNITVIMNGELSLADGLKHFSLIREMSSATISSQQVQQLLMDPQEQFDAVIAEWMYSELYSGLASVFGCPLIWSSSMEPHDLVLGLMGERACLACVPDHMSAAKMPLGFMGRVEQLILVSFLRAMRWVLFSQEEQSFAEIYGPAAAKRGRHLPTLTEARYNASLMLGNSHVSSGHAIPLPQSYKSVGGYHIEKNAKPLPKDWQKIMDEATDGVIYFSMGTMLKSKQLPQEIKDGILDVFRSLKQTVIWKFEADLPNRPKNVHIVSWAPQPSILAHPNCVLFITHGGLLSTAEALHFEVPIIGIPMFADQFNNINTAEYKGFGKPVSLGYDTPVHLKAAIEEMLGNPRYRNVMKEYSLVYHNRPVSPGEELVFWVEHVVKTRGAPHLRSPALHLPFYQKMYLDLAAGILTVVLLIIYSLRLLFRSKKVDVNKKNN